MNTTLTFNNIQYPDAQLNESISEILSTHNSLAMATISKNKSYINTAHYGFSEKIKLAIFTQPFTQHSQNVSINSSVAVAIWNEPVIPGNDLQGLQLFGACERVPDNELEEAIAIYATGNPGFANLIKTPKDFETVSTQSRLYWIKTEHLKLIDELRFGKRNYIELIVTN